MPTPRNRPATSTVLAISPDGNGRYKPAPVVHDGAITSGSDVDYSLFDQIQTLEGISCDVSHDKFARPDYNLDDPWQGIPRSGLPQTGYQSSADAGPGSNGYILVVNSMFDPSDDKFYSATIKKFGKSARGGHYAGLYGNFKYFWMGTEDAAGHYIGYAAMYKQAHEGDIFVKIFSAIVSYLVPVLAPVMAGIMVAYNKSIASQLAQSSQMGNNVTGQAATNLGVEDSSQNVFASFGGSGILGILAGVVLLLAILGGGAKKK